MGEFKFFCSRCGQAIQCDTGYCGSQINCPACQQKIDVPRLGGIPAAKPPLQAKSRMPIIVGTIVLFAVVVGAGLLLLLKPHGKPAGLVAWWPAEGNAKDRIWHHNGTMVNGASYDDGKAGQAFFFDGKGQYVKISQSPRLNPVNELTIEFWMKADPKNPMNSYQGLVTSDYYGVEIAGGVSLYLSSNHSASWEITSHASLASGVWHHIAGTYDGASLRLFVDGQSFGSPLPHIGKISPMLAGSFVAIGSEDGRTGDPGCIGSRYFHGLIDEVSIYNRALSAAEIKTLYKAGTR